MKRKYYSLPLSNITAKIESTVHPMKTNDEINEIFTDFAFDVYGSIIPEDQPNLVKARQKILDLKDKWEREAALLRTEIFEQSGAEDYLDTILKADRNKLIKHLAFEMGENYEAMMKIAKGMK